MCVGGGGCVRACLRACICNASLAVWLLVPAGIACNNRYCLSVLLSGVTTRVLNLTASVQRTGLRVYVRGSR